MKAEVQGGWLDGEAGIASPKGEKVLKYARLACELLIRGRASQKELQIVGGGFVYIAMFRRPLLAGLNALLRRIIELGEVPAKERGPRRGCRGRAGSLYCFDSTSLHGLPLWYIRGCHSQ